MSADLTSSLISMINDSLSSAYQELSPNWPKDYGRTFVSLLDPVYDFIVVGGGTSGSVIASRLSENPEWKVLLLEAGGDPTLGSEIPYISCGGLDSDGSKNIWKSFAERSTKFGLGQENERLAWISGKGLSGTAAINGMIYTIGNKLDYEEWKKLGCDNWGWADVKPYFEKSKADGMKLVEIDRESTTIFKRAIQEIGIQLNHSNGEGNIGYQKLLAFIFEGRRQTSAKQFLCNLNRKNLHVIKHAVVKKVIFKNDGSTVDAVRFSYNGSEDLTARASKEVILSAGATASPKILIMSGIGTAEQLENINVKMIRELPVGLSLQDHVSVTVFFKVKSDTSFIVNDFMNNLYEYLMKGNRGPLAKPFYIPFVGFVDTSGKALYPDIQYVHAYVEKGTPYSNPIRNFKDFIMDSINEALQEGGLIQTEVILLRPKSKGSIKLRTSNYLDDPVIDCNFFDDSYDRTSLLKGVEFLLKFLETEAFKEVNASLLKFNFDETDNYFESYLKFMSNHVFHPVGTVKMGSRSDKTAVVDPDLKVKGLKGLRVADASIMPNVISGNTAAPSIMIAEKAADIIKEEYRKINVLSKL